MTEAVRSYLKAAGTETRYQLDTGEKAIDLVLQAGREALEDAQVAPEEVDLLIYTGIGRGWIEPAMANAVQAGLHLVNATSFDILDACASWLRALHVCQQHIRSGVYRSAMIVTRVRSVPNIRRLEDRKHRDGAPPACRLHDRRGCYCRWLLPMRQRMIGYLSSRRSQSISGFACFP